MILSSRVRRPYGRVLAAVVLLWSSGVAAQDGDDSKNGTRGVDEFLS